MTLTSRRDHTSHQAQHQTHGRQYHTLSNDPRSIATSPELPSMNNHTCIVTVGQRLPDSIMNIELPAQDGNPITLQLLLDQSIDGIIVSVFSKLSKEVFLSEFQALAPGLVYPDIHLTSIGLSNYPVPMNASIVEECQEYLPDEHYYLLGDPRGRLLEAMGFVRSPARSKTWITRIRRQGRIKCGFFIVRKDRTLYAKQTGPLASVLEGIEMAGRRLHRQWVSDLRRLGKPIPPW